MSSYDVDIKVTDFVISGLLVSLVFLFVDKDVSVMILIVNCLIYSIWSLVHEFIK